MKILAVCAHGLGSSFLMEMNIKKVLTKLGIEAEVNHADFSVTSSDDADLFVMGEDIAGSCNIDRSKVITLRNLVGLPEYEAKLVAYFQEKGIIS